MRPTHWFALLRSWLLSFLFFMLCWLLSRRPSLSGFCISLWAQWKEAPSVPEGTVITVVVAAMEAGSPFRSPPWHLHGLQAPGRPSCWKLIHTLLSCCLKPGLRQVCGEAFGCCVCSSNSCRVSRDLAAQSIPCSAVWAPAKLKALEGQSWKFSVIAFQIGAILCHC